MGPRRLCQSVVRSLDLPKRVAARIAPGFLVVVVLLSVKPFDGRLPRHRSALRRLALPSIPALAVPPSAGRGAFPARRSAAHQAAERVAVPD